jgi:aromatic ring-cleaving dioxygenase
MANKFEQLEWLDPRKKIWGFHVHQELPLADFSRALVVQEKCAEFLTQHNVTINAADVITPGYGPHLDYMWELRVETLTEQVLEKLGMAVSYMAVNRFGLSAYIHPLMHDTSLPEDAALHAEGRENQANALWFTNRVPQHQDFFFHPPKDESGNILDTRTSRIMQQELKNELISIGKDQLKNDLFRDPAAVIIRGFHIHMDFNQQEQALALNIFDRFIIYLLGHEMRPTSTRLYGPRENGPHVLGGWEVKFETENKDILRMIGIAIAWLMCNRHGLAVFMHPVTWYEGDFPEELKAHSEYTFFLGELPALDLSFFSDKIAH